MVSFLLNLILFLLVKDGLKPNLLNLFINKILSSFKNESVHINTLSLEL